MMCSTVWSLELISIAWRLNGVPTKALMSHAPKYMRNHRILVQTYTTQHNTTRLFELGIFIGGQKHPQNKLMRGKIV